MVNIENINKDKSMKSASDIYYEIYIYLDAIWRRRYFVAVSILVMPILALIASTIIPKWYEASTSITAYNAPDPAMKSFEEVTHLSAQFKDLKEFIFAPKVLKKIALQSGLLKASASPKALQQSIAYFTENLDVSLVGKNTIKIQMKGRDPNKMVPILNLLRSVLIDHLTKQQNTQSASSVKFLENQLTAQKEILQNARNILSQYEKQNTEFLPAYRSLYATRLSQIISEQGNTEAEYHTKQAEQEALKQVLIKLNPILGNIDGQILENDMKLSQLRAIYTDNYSEIKATIQYGLALQAERVRVLKQYANLSEQKLQTLMDMTASNEETKKNNASQSLLTQQLNNFQILNVNLKGLSEKLNTLKKQQQALTEKLEKIDTLTPEWSKLTEAVKINFGFYQDLLQRYKMAQVREKYIQVDQQSNIEILALPETPFLSLGRGTLFYLFIGLLSGIILGLSLTVFFEIIDNTVRRKKTVESLINTLVISRVPKLSLE